MDGWISIDRGIIESRLFSRSGNHVKISLFILLCANHKPKFHRGIEIKRGQCVRSLTQISEACDVSRKAVRCAIDNMVKDGFISVDEPFGAHKGHRITVCNYDTYQSSDSRKGIDRAQQGHTEGTVTPTNNNDKKENISEIGRDFLKRFNETTGKKHRTLPSKAETQFNARIKEGYTVDDLIKATENAMGSDHHKSNNLSQLTPELITRGDKLEAWLNSEAPKKAFVANGKNLLGQDLCDGLTWVEWHKKHGEGK